MTEALTTSADVRTLEEIELSVKLKTQTLRRMLLAGACEIGYDLTKAKEKCPHGKWGDSLRRMGYKASTAANYMRLFEEYGKQGAFIGNLQTFANMDYTKALALLALPAPEREEFAEAVNAEEISVRELKAEIKKYQEIAAAAENQANGWRMKAEAAKADADIAWQSAEEVSKEHEFTKGLLVSSRAEASKLEAQVKDLQNRPIEVAVKGASEEQIATARLEAEAAALSAAADRMEAAEQGWKAQVDALKSKLKEADRQNENLSERNRELSFEADALKKENGELAAERNDLQAQINEHNADHDSSRQQPDAPGKAEEINATFRQVVDSTNKLLSMLIALDEVAQTKVRAKLSGFFLGAAEKVKK